MQKTLRLPALFLAFLLLVASMAMPAAAAGAGFSVSPVLPENQKAGDAGYFDLMVKPGETQELTIKIDNSADEDINVTVEAITASTNYYGELEYSANGTNDETMKNSFSEMAKVPEGDILIPAKSNKEIKIPVTMPAESFDGMILGSIRVLKALSQAEKDSGQMIVNQFAYVIGVRLQANETEIPADFLLKEVKAELVNYSANIIAYIRNPQAKLVKGATGSFKVYEKGKDAVIMELTKDKIDFAPNTVYAFSLVDDAGYGLKSGTYTAKIALAFEGKDWNFEQDFEIKADEAKAINAGAVNQGTQQANPNAVGGMPTWVLIALIAGGVIVLIVIIILVRKMMANNDAKTALELEKMKKKFDDKKNDKK